MRMRDRVNRAEKLEDIKSNCYLCGKEVDGNAFCFGCNHFVCPDCEGKPDALPRGRHRVIDHQEAQPKPVSFGSVG